MSNFQQRDDEKKDRLSSFLHKKGSLETARIDPIKKHVFYLTTVSGRPFILKKHHHVANVRQQWEFFQKIRTEIVVPFSRFPNGKKFIFDDYGFIWTISPYIRGRKLHYRNPVDRSLAVETLRHFHKRATFIHISKPLQKRLFYVRWHQRLQSFKKTEKHFIYYGYENLYRDIVKVTEKTIDVTSRFPWQQYERHAVRRGTWIHGDVASHNFLHNEKTYLIDFDLLACTSQINDYIQLAQRFLPYIQWDLDTLLNYGMTKERERNRWLSGVSIPSDVLREWLYFLARQAPVSIPTYLKGMEEEWEMRKNFLKKVSFMLKSI